MSKCGLVLSNPQPHPEAVSSSDFISYTRRILRSGVNKVKEDKRCADMSEFAMNDPPPHLVQLPIEGGHVAADSGTGVPA